MRIALAALITVATLMPAQAGEREQIQAPFTYSVAELETREGATKILRHLVRLAKTSCRVAHTDEQLVVRDVDRDCVDEFLNDAVIKIDAMHLTQVYEQSFG